jgi:predicted AlkP superfamily pyrophosphatase or phosphodiesterase
MSIKYRFKDFLTIIILFVAFTVQAQNKRTIAPEKPTLIVSIVVEQMRYDFLDRYYNEFDTDGFKRLILGGAFYKNAHLNYMFSQSSPGYASIYTGATPSVHGIVADQWYKNISESKIKSTQNKKYKTVGSASKYGEHAPNQLITSTISDELKLVNKHSKVISIGLDASASCLSGGHMADASYWLDEQTGKWISSRYYLDSLPTWVNTFNDKESYKTYLDREWTLYKKIGRYTKSRSDTAKYETGFGINHYTFPYNITEISNIKSNYPDYSVLNTVPFGNNYTKDFAIQTIVEEGLGKDAHTDFLMLNFTATKNISNRFGPLSVEVEDTYLRLDQDIQHFLKFLDEEIGKHNYLVILSSNHGVAYSPKYLEENKIPSGNFKSTYSIALLKSYLNALYGKGDWVKLYYNQQIYLNHLLIEDSKLRLEDIQQKVVDFMIQFDGIANAVSSTTLKRSEFNRGIYKKMQNSYNQRRSGDVMLNLKSGWLEDITSTSSSNSPYVYDTHIPLIWYGWRIKRQESSEDVDITDIAPTISNFLNIEKPNGCTGKTINGLIK